MNEVLISKQNSTIVLTLNREKVLNALNLNMVRIIADNILKWNEDDSISGILLKGAGKKAFCDNTRCRERSIVAKKIRDIKAWRRKLYAKRK